MSHANVEDPYQLHPEAVEDPPNTFVSILRRIGPGLILQTGAKVVSVVSVQVTCNYQGPFDENLRPRTPYVEICEMQYTVY
jgi:hypothetical protein